jgi:Ser/Thr protein kinase RdoA (MazF antagonist)
VKPVLLADDSNALVHLAPAPVVARVATTTALVRPQPVEWLAREVAVAGHLAACGAPVVAPSEELPPGPHSRDGFDLTFWRYVERETATTPEMSQVATGLAGLHDALRDYPGELPYLEPALGEVRRMLDYADAHQLLAADDLEALRTRHARLDRVLAVAAGESRPLHGDAHVGNVFVTPEGVLWSDFEDTCTGPVGWDLACLMRGSAFGEETALAAYGESPSREELEPFLEARELQGIAWLTISSQRFPERRGWVQERLRAWRDGV